jgi:photosystem II stability/assembly factor-like uncharacterized protein
LKPGSRPAILMRLHLPLLLGLSALANAQWTQVDVPTTASLRGLSAVSATIVWASGTGGTVIKTIDGGKTWSVIVVPGAEKLDFRGIRAFDDKNALIMSSGPAEQGQAQIYWTSDGGQRWQQVFEEKRPGIFFDAIAFWDRRHGIVLSDPVDGHFALFRTDDAGATWKQVPPAGLPPALPNEGAFAASNSCLTVEGENNVWFATGGAKVARVFRSSDRGKTWSVAETPMHPANASSGIFSLAFSDVKNGIAVGGDYAHPDGSDLPNVMFTGDGGRSWQVGAGTSPAGMYFSSVTGLPLPGSQGFVVTGIKGALMYVGRWTRVSEENLNSVAVTGGPPTNVWAADAWAVGPKGSVVHATIKYTFTP